MKTDPTCTDSGRFWVQFCSQIGLEFGTEKFDRFGFGFGFNFVVTTVSGLGSICENLLQQTKEYTVWLDLNILSDRKSTHTCAQPRLVPRTGSDASAEIYKSTFLREKALVSIFT